MANQNILNYYGSKLDLKVDYSELYDFELSKTQDDFDAQVLDFTTPITYSGLTIDSSCLTTGLTTPFQVLVNEPYTGGTCDFTVRRRTEKGWTLDFVFSGNTTGTTFYFLGLEDDLIDTNYADNNLFFSFTSDNRIHWAAYHYSGFCQTSGYSETYYVASGQTEPLCLNGTSSDFNITITFDRYKHYVSCDVENQGGFNDLILGPHAVPYTDTIVSAVTSTQIVSGYTITNNFKNWITGETITYEYVESLNKKWAEELDRRLGTLKIYLNGNPIYKAEHFEEIIPSPRQSENSMVQIWGSSSTKYVTKKIKYFEEPLDFVHVKHHHITEIIPNFSINDCTSPCVEALRSISVTSTPTVTPTSSVTPTNTPTITPTITLTPTITVTPTTSYCYRYTSTNNPTINLTQFNLGANSLDISYRDFYGRQYDFSRLVQNNVIYFTDLITQASYGTFTVNSGGVVDNGTYWTISGNFLGDLSANPSINFNICFITTTLTPTPSITPTFTTTPSVTPTNTITPTRTVTPTLTSTNTPTITPTNTITSTQTVTPTKSVTPTHTPTKTITPTPTLTSTNTPTITLTSSVTATRTPTPSVTKTVTPTISVTPTHSVTPSQTVTNTPTRTMTATPTPTPTPLNFTNGAFTFDADYIILTYTFTDGTDLDTRTRISSPDIGQNDSSLYLGWCRADRYPLEDGIHNPVMTWGGDNTGTGFESVFINLIEFKSQYPSYSGSTITIDMNAIWYGSLGTQPIIMNAVMYKGGTVSLDSGNYLFTNQGYSAIYGVASTGTTLTVIDNDNEKCPQQEPIALLQYNLLNYQGQFI